MFNTPKLRLAAACAAACLSLAACGGGGGGSAPPAAGGGGGGSTASYTIGGSAQAFSGVLSLQDVFGPAGGATTTDPLTLKAPGDFMFSQKVPQGDSYTVSVATQPTAQFCSAPKASGTATANVTNLAFGCVPGSLQSVYTNTSASDGVGGKGMAPLLFDSQGNLYGEMSAGGANNDGVIYKIDPTGKLTVLWNFKGGTTGGASPIYGLTRGANGNLYGVTQQGGVNGSPGAGTVFELTSSGLTLLHSFTSVGASTTATDGVAPNSPLLLANDGNFYGTVAEGGANGTGGIYKITPKGVFSMVYSFPPAVSSGPLNTPVGALMQASDGKIYGTCVGNGSGNEGGVFSYDPTTGVERDVADAPAGGSGIAPAFGVVQAPNGDFYGVSYSSPTGGLFKVTSAGVWVDIYAFGTNTGDVTDSYGPIVVGNDGKLYGSAATGGKNGNGGIWAYDPTTNTESVVTSYSSFGGRGTSLGLAPNGWMYSTNPAPGVAWTVFAFD